MVKHTHRGLVSHPNRFSLGATVRLRATLYYLQARSRRFDSIV